MSETNSIAMSPEKEENDAYEAFVAVLRDYMDKLVEWLNESEVQTSKDKTALKEPVAEQAPALPMAAPELPASAPALPTAAADKPATTPAAPAAPAIPATPAAK